MISNNPFIRKTRHRIQGGDIKTIFGHRGTEGTVGLEIEVEGNSFPKNHEAYDDYGDLIYHESDEIPGQWAYTHDGSLRGEDNAEYILAQPLEFSEVSPAVDDLWKMFHRHGSVLDESNRTSVHVHLNVQDWHLNRVCAFIGLYIIVEDILTHWCGDHRVGNLFCLRAKDAPGIVSRLKQFFRTEHAGTIDNGLHYSGLNAHALKKLGSLEVRTMRGVNDPDTIKTWVAILERLYRLSESYPDPRDIVHGFSGQARESFLEGILGPFTGKIVDECGLTREQISNSLLEGIRIAQSLCYCRDWSRYEPANNEPDVFGRSPFEQGDMPEPVMATASAPPATSAAAASADPAIVTSMMNTYMQYTQAMNNTAQEQWTNIDEILMWEEGDPV